MRDKDAVISCALMAETAAWAISCGKSLYEQLIDIYLEFGFYKESLVNLVKKGKSGAEEIQEVMEDLRAMPPKTLNGTDVIFIHDYLKQESLNLTTGKKSKISLPKSNVLQFILKDDSKISVRPSGTEPKIKFYFSVNDILPSRNEFEEVNKSLEKRLAGIRNEFIS